MTREKCVTRDVTAGCLACSGEAVRWSGSQAIGTAARHHDRSGHRTWFKVVTDGRYGRELADDAQLDIETAIAAA